MQFLTAAGSRRLLLATARLFRARGMPARALHTPRNAAIAPASRAAILPNVVSTIHFRTVAFAEFAKGIKELSRCLAHDCLLGYFYHNIKKVNNAQLTFAFSRVETDSPFVIWTCDVCSYSRVML